VEFVHTEKAVLSMNMYILNSIYVCFSCNR